MIGKLVIVNEVDQPCARLIAEVVGIDDKGWLLCEYLDERIRHRVMTIDPARATPVADFGVRPSYCSSLRHISLERFTKSKATYPDRDGKIREWQPEPGEELLRLRDGSSAWRTEHATRYFMRVFSAMDWVPLSEYVLPFLARIQANEFDDLADMDKHAKRIMGWASYDTEV